MGTKKVFETHVGHPRGWTALFDDETGTYLEVPLKQLLDPLPKGTKVTVTVEIHDPLI